MTTIPAQNTATKTDPHVSAQQAGLRYVSDDKPGLTRRRTEDDFDYCTSKGELVTDEASLTRIKKLGIPPAYEDVWICPQPNGHLQATGHDARGRKQYRYHEKWRQVRDGSKYGRMIAFGEALPRIRAVVDADLARHGMPREKVLAAVVRLLEETHIRIGSEEYARENQSFGLTTLHNQHVDITGTTSHFHFRGKSGKNHAIDLRDARLARIIRQCQELPGDDLFEYVAHDGQPHAIGSGDVNDYLHEASGQDFTAKDFRTWAGTILAARTLAACEPCASAAHGKRSITQAIKEVAAQLGNTPAVCRKCYVHPAILESYTAGTLLDALQSRSPESIDTAVPVNRREEEAVLHLLRAAEEQLGKG